MIRGEERPTDDLVAYAFRCHDCTHSLRLKNAYEDPTTASGACPCCGGENWNIYGKTRSGTIVRLA